MKISKLNINSTSDQKKLFSLINKCDSSVFFSLEWLKILNHKNFEILGIKNLNDELIGAFYFQKYKRKKFFNQFSPPPLCPYNWLIINCESETIFNKVTFHKKVFKEIASYLDAVNCDILKINFPTSFEDLSPFIKSGYETRLKFTYVLDLNLSQEDLLKNMSSERRRNINKGLKSSLKVETNGNKNDLLGLVFKTIDREKLDLDKVFVEKVIFEFANESNAFFQVAYQDGEPCAASFFVYDKNYSYYLLGGYDPSFNNEFAGPMCMWNGIIKAKSIGVSFFDFEGSMQPKIEKYFRGFGGTVKMIPLLYKSKQLSKFVKT